MQETINSLLLQINGYLLDILTCERSCFQLPKTPIQETKFNELSLKIKDILTTFHELKQQKLDSGFAEKVELKETALIKLLQLFVASPELHDTMHDLYRLEKQLLGLEPVLELKIDTVAIKTPLLEKLCSSFKNELTQLSVLESELKETKIRLRQRDEYMQNTISETTKKIQFLEQLVETRVDSSIGLKLHTPGKGSIEDVELDEFERIAFPYSASESTYFQALNDTTITSQDMDQELLSLLDQLTNLTEEKELLEQDLCIVRLQVEHLEAIGRERDQVITTLYKKREQRRALEIYT